MNAFSTAATLSARLFALIISITTGLLALPAEAHWDTPARSGVGNWEASLDGITWVPAFSNYPNPISRIDPATVETDLAPPPELMWYWGSEKPFIGSPNGATGPNTAFFRFTFTLTQDDIDCCGGPPNAWVAADDWMTWSINSHHVGDYLLDNHKDPLTGQPIPVAQSYDKSFLLVGQNTILIEAHDGGVIAANRAFEWVYFDGLTSPNLSPTFVAVPEPSSLTLLLAALGGAGVGVVGARRRRVTETP